MRALIQRVTNASVTIGGTTTAQINRGLLILLGVTRADTEADSTWLANKTATLRIFPDDADQMNRSLLDTSGDALVVSQFTLCADTRKGTRPSFNDAAPPHQARHLYQHYIQQLETLLKRPVPTGTFAARMQIALTNDGPVTLLLESPRPNPTSPPLRTQVPERSDGVNS